MARERGDAGAGLGAGGGARVDAWTKQQQQQQQQQEQEQWLAQQPREQRWREGLADSEEDLAVQQRDGLEMGFANEREFVLAALERAGAEAAATEEDGLAYARNRWITTSAVSKRRWSREVTSDARAALRNMKGGVKKALQEARDMISPEGPPYRSPAHLGWASPNCESGEVNDRLVDDLLHYEVAQHLDSLDLVGNLLLSEPFTTLLKEKKTFPKLRSLRLGHCLCASKSSLKSIGLLFPGLTSLELACCLAVDDDVLGTLALELSNLKHLDIAGCSQVTDRGVQKLAVMRGAQLVSLNLTGLCELTDQSLIGQYKDPYDSKVWSALEAFSCVGCIGLTDRGILSLLRRCAPAKLRVLHVAGVRKISDVVLLELARENVLMEVDVSDNPSLSTSGLSVLVASSRNTLCTLRATSCPLVESSFAQMMATHFPLVDTEVDESSLRLSWDHLKLILSIAMILGGSYVALTYWFGVVGAMFWYRGIQIASAVFATYLVLVVTIFVVAASF